MADEAFRPFSPIYPGCRTVNRRLTTTQSGQNSDKQISQVIDEQFLRSCYEINYTDCAGWFFEIKEENAAVPGYGEAF